MEFLCLQSVCGWRNAWLIEVGRKRVEGIHIRLFDVHFHYWGVMRDSSILTHARFQPPPHPPPLHPHRARMQGLPLQFTRVLHTSGSRLWQRQSLRWRFGRGDEHNMPKWVFPFQLRCISKKFVFKSETTSLWEHCGIFVFFSEILNWDFFQDFPEFSLIMYTHFGKII